MAKQPWLVTSSLIKFYPFNPRTSEIRLRDIAKSHACQTRWNGQGGFYSIAQHDVMVSQIVEGTDPQHALEGFCHDFAEAITGDMASPMKRQLPDFVAMEEPIERAISRKFNLKFPWPPSIKEADLVALVTEAWHLFVPDVKWIESTIFGTDSLNLTENMIRHDLWESPWTPTESEVRFYRRWDELMEKRSEQT